MRKLGLLKPLFLLAAAALLMGVFSNGAAIAAEKSCPEPPKGKSVYGPPDPLPPGNHGDLIWATEISTQTPGARAWKVLYRSTDIHNAPQSVSGLVVAPIEKKPDGDRPIVSYGHGTTGLARRCGISNVDNPAKDARFFFFPNSSDNVDSGIPGLTKMIAAGYVVVATDYNGLGGPGIHQYLVGPTAARNVLDIALAAQQIPEVDAGRKVVVTGWSQGGQAAVWASQIADYVSGSIDVMGVVAMAPVNAFEQLKIEQEIVASGKSLPVMTSSETVMAQYASTIVFPELKLSDVLTPFGIEFLEESIKNQCSKQMGYSLAYMQSWKGSATRTNPENQEAWMKRSEQLALGNVQAKTPLAVYQGQNDPTIFPEATKSYVKKACQSGVTISYITYPDTDHVRVVDRAQADFLKWIADRFEGKPAPSSCK